MHVRSVVGLIILAVLPFLGSCTSKYQDLLRDRDAQIRELNGTVARLNAERDELQRENANLKGQVARPEPASADRGRIKDLPEDAEQIWRRDRMSIGVNDSITFDSGSSTLKSSAGTVLKKIADILKRDFSGRRIYVEGHTDTDPINKTKDKYKDNLDLSAERAGAVARFLIEQGVPARQVSIVGYGQHDPLDAGTKARNRRVEIVPGEKF